jgi:hypothetical protein
VKKVPSLRITQISMTGVGGGGEEDERSNWKVKRALSQTGSRNLATKHPLPTKKPTPSSACPRLDIDLVTADDIHTATICLDPTLASVSRLFCQGFACLEPTKEEIPFAFHDWISTQLLECYMFELNSFWPSFIEHRNMIRWSWVLVLIDNSTVTA